MKIVYLAAGAAGMYCGSCLHDNTLAAALSAAGDDVLLVPTYTPLRTDEPNVSIGRVFLGGVNVYLQQVAPVFRHTPRWLDAMLDWPVLIRRVSRRNAAIDPAKLGALTVSVLRAEDGNQRKEVRRLVDWLHREVRPDVVHLSNSMLIGLAAPLGRRLQVPVVCSLSGEDIFLEKLSEPHRTRARRLIGQGAAEVAAFVAMNHYFAGYMADYMQIGRERIQVVPHGLNLVGHGQRPKPLKRESFTIGYLARICPDKGLHLLVDAFLQLAADQALPPIRLHVAGYLGAGDRSYLEQLTKKIDKAGLQSRFRYHGELNREEKIAFLQSLDVMSVPTVYRESKGIPVLEAWANAVPVVEPAHGCFPELIADTGGGMLCDPENPTALAAALKQLILDPAAADQYGRNGQAAVRARYHAGAMAEKTRQLYQTLTGAHVENVPHHSAG